MQSCARGTVAVRFAIGLAVAAVLLGSLRPSPAHTANGFEDHFQAPNGVPLIMGPTGANWVISPDDTTTKFKWVIETRPTAVNVAQLGTMSVLVDRSTAASPNEPIAFLKKEYSNFVVQSQAAFDRTVPVNSGVGLVFRAPIDPNTGAIDRNNLYLLTSVNAAPNPRTFPTGHAFMIFKRVAGVYYMAAPPVNTWTDFANSRFHTYKVAMESNHIQAWIDGFKIFDLADRPGDDKLSPTSPYTMPGPAFVSGAVGLRASRTQALFDDFVVSGSPAYEGRAAALNIYGQVGLERAGPSTTQTGNIPAGVDQGVSGGDTGFQYHDHDFNQPVNGPLSGPGGSLAVASLFTKGTTDPETQAQQTTSAAQVAGFSGVFTDPNGRGTVTLSADLIRAHATGSCEGTNSTVDVVNLMWEVVYRDAELHPVTTQGSTTRFNAPPNTNLLDPRSQTGPIPDPDGENAGINPDEAFGGFSAQFPVRITLHSRQTASQPQRIEAAAIRISFLTSTNVNGSTPGTIMADVAIANVVAGKLCDPGP